MASRRSRQLVSLALVALFSFGVGTEAYGWHGCPHHQPEEGPTRAAVETPVSRTVADDPGETGTSPEGPCICVGSCHTGATAPLPATPPPTLATADATPLPPKPSAATLPRVSDPYLLPFPNAPPRPAPGAVQA